MKKGISKADRSSEDKNSKKKTNIKGKDDESTDDEKTSESKKTWKKKMPNKIGNFRKVITKIENKGNLSLQFTPPLQVYIPKCTYLLPRSYSII